MCISKNINTGMKFYIFHYAGGTTRLSPNPKYVKQTQSPKKHAPETGLSPALEKDFH